MGCKRRTVKFGKWVARTLGAIVVQRIANVVTILDDAPPGWMSNSDKRRLVIEAAKSELARQRDLAVDQLGSEVEMAIRAAIEHALWNVRDGADAREIADSSDDDEGDLPDKPVDDVVVDPGGGAANVAP